jgi:hypothetical protein
MKSRIGIVALLIIAIKIAHAADYPPPTENDYTIHDFKFTSGETLPELKIHYRTGSLQMLFQAALETYTFIGLWMRPSYSASLPYLPLRSS